MSLDAKWRWNWGIACGVWDVREGTEGFFVVVKMGEKDVYELEERMAPEKLRLWEGRSVTENLSVL